MYLLNSCLGLVRYLVCHAMPPPAVLCCALAVQVSAPPLIAWKYNVVPEAGSEEDKLLQVLRTPREWV